MQNSCSRLPSGTTTRPSLPDCKRLPCSMEMRESLQQVEKNALIVHIMEYLGGQAGK